MHFIRNCGQSEQRRHGSRCVGRYITRVEPTIKVWSDAHGGSGLNSWFDLNCVGATKITAKPRSRRNLNLVQAWSTLVKRALSNLLTRGRNVLGTKRPGGELTKGQNVHKSVVQCTHCAADPYKPISLTTILSTSKLVRPSVCLSVLCVTLIMKVSIWQPLGSPVHPHQQPPTSSVWRWCSVSSATLGPAPSSRPSDLSFASCDRPPSSLRIGTLPYSHTDSTSIRLCSALRPLQHSIGYMADGFYRWKDPTNSIKVLKEMLQRKRKTTQRT